MKDGETLLPRDDSCCLFVLASVRGVHLPVSEPAWWACTYAGVADDTKRKVDRLLIRLNRTVMGATMFRTCVEQNFAVEAYGGAFASIQDNAGLMQELHDRIESRVDFTMKVVGTDSELHEAQEVVGVFALYVLYRLISPRATHPSKELFAKLWRVQEKVPVVVLYGKVFWTPEEFLLKYAPIRSLDVKKLQPRVRHLRVLMPCHCESLCCTPWA